MKSSGKGLHFGVDGHMAVILKSTTLDGDHFSQMTRGSCNITNHTKMFPEVMPCMTFVLPVTVSEFSSLKHFSTCIHLSSSVLTRTPQHLGQI